MKIKKIILIFVLCLTPPIAHAGSLHSSSKFSVRWLHFYGSVEDRFFEKGNLLYSYDYLINFEWIKLGASVGFLREKSFLIGIDSGRESGEEMTLTLLPLEVYTELTPLEYLKLYVQPFAGFGYQAYAVWLQEPEQSINTYKQGLSLKAGIRFSLRDYTSMGSKELFDIENIFIDAFASHRPIFSSGLDLSAWDYGVALGLDF